MPSCTHCQRPTRADGRCATCDLDPTADTAAPPVEPGPAAAHFEPAEGARLGAFVLTDYIASGAMGEVWRGRHARLDQDVAVKFLKPELARVDAQRARFEREAVATARIRHPAFPQLWAWEAIGDRWYLVMDFVEGPTVEQRLAAEGPLDAARARQLGRQIADALAALHRAGIVHRDLKPANMKWVTDPAGDEHVFILDLGICKPLGGWDAAVLQTQGPIGTPLYMAPEQCGQSDAVGPRTDQFALGCILYEMVTGVRPFMAPDIAGVVKRVCFRDPEPPSSLQPTLPSALDAVIMRLLAKAPEARFADMNAVAAALAPTEAPVDVVSRPRIERRGILQLALAGLSVALGIRAAACGVERLEPVEAPAIEVAAAVTPASGTPLPAAAAPPIAAESPLADAPAPPDQGPPSAPGPPADAAPATPPAAREGADRPAVTRSTKRAGASKARSRRPARPSRVAQEAAPVAAPAPSAVEAAPSRVAEAANRGSLTAPTPTAPTATAPTPTAPPAARPTAAPPSATESAPARAPKRRPESRKSLMQLGEDLERAAGG